MSALLLLALAGAGAVVALASSSSSSSSAANELPPHLAAMSAALREKKLADIRALQAPAFMGILPVQQESMRLRRRELLRAFPDAHPLAADKYSSGTFQVRGFAVDEFGRYYKGVPWDPGGFALDVAAQVVPYLPLPPGTKAALMIVIAVGRGEAIDNAALQALEAELPPAARMGVHIAAGLYAGESLDQATLDAVWAEYPEAKQGYDAARKVLSS